MPVFVAADVCRRTFPQFSGSQRGLTSTATNLTTRAEGERGRLVTGLPSAERALRPTRPGYFTVRGEVQPSVAANGRSPHFPSAWKSPRSGQEIGGEHQCAATGMNPEKAVGTADFADHTDEEEVALKCAFTRRGERGGDSRSRPKR